MGEHYQLFVFTRKLNHGPGQETQDIERFYNENDGREFAAFVAFFLMPAVFLRAGLTRLVRRREADSGFESTEVTKSGCE